MRSIPYRKTDAFVEGASLGNPAACLFPARGQEPTDDELLEIARRHRGFVSEVVCCTLAESGSYVLSFWSSACEVDFCGHGTIACMHSLIRTEPALFDLPEIRIDTRRKGPLTVYNRIRTQNAVYVSAPPARQIETGLSCGEVARALGAREEALDPALPLGCVDAGLVTLLVPFASLEDVIRLQPDQDSLRLFCLAHGIGIVLAFSLLTSQSGRHAHTRVFAPRFGYLEDPATGSGNSAFGTYLWENGRWDGSGIAIEQGGAGTVYNIVRLSREQGDILFGGAAADRIVGEYLL